MLLIISIPFIALVIIVVGKIINIRRKKSYERSTQNRVMLFIKDNGIGIKYSDLPRVFEKGFTGSNRNKEYATGIGLYLCKKLCNKLNLDININSEEGIYTEVRINLPNSDYNLQISSR